MRRRPSGSAAEDEDEDSFSAASSTVASPVGAQGEQSQPDPASTEESAKKPPPLKSGGKKVERASGTEASPAAGLRPWKPPTSTAASSGKRPKNMIPLAREITIDKMPDPRVHRRPRPRSPWLCSLATFLTFSTSAVILFTIVRSFLVRHLDVKGCRMPRMHPAYAELVDFDTEHTRFATKYSLYLYREVGIDDDDLKVNGVPVIFIPGNAGSYRQVRSIAAEAAYYFHNIVQHDPAAIEGGARSLDFFTVDFNEDITAFHGQTLLDQAEYLNDAVAYILSLYHDSRRSTRDSDLPDPTSVIVLGHSMGGIVARTMLTMPNYQSSTINTIITMSAPHARPPVSFDSDVVKTYKRINDYWRQAYSQKWANNNPLWHVTLISIAGGSLDTVVPSDYASLTSLVPETHGFTVFTSSVPNVWTGMDHQQILWCDQLRRAVVRSLMEIVDVNRPGQTKLRLDRMRIFKKWFLTGMEGVVEKTLPQRDPTTLLTLEDNSNSIISEDTRLTLRKFGHSRKPRAYLLPVPPQGTPGGKKFTLLTDQRLDAPGENGKLEVLFCSVFPLHPGQSATLFSMNMDLSGDSSGSTRLACKNAAADIIPLPASTRTSKFPFEDTTPFSYLQYDLEDIAEHQYVAVVDKAVDPTSGWVVAEFTNAESTIRTNIGLTHLLTVGMRMRLPATRPMMVDVKIPALHSSLLAYKLSIGSQACGDEGELFTPLLRQYVSDPYESKYFVNVRQANINLHGIAPFMPPPLKARSSGTGASLQFWFDPTCNTSVDISLKVDVVGSMGKLPMRYRTVLAAFPLLVVALVLRKQFSVYDSTGVFMSFSEGTDLVLRQSLPIVLLALTFFSMSLVRANSEPPKSGIISNFFNWRDNATESAVDFTRNDLLLGSQDPFFWFLVPLLGLVSAGVCVAVHYITLIITHTLATVYGLLTTRPGWMRNDDKKRVAMAFAPSSPRRRIITTSILLFFVATFIPYQFAYMVACIVQIATCVRALHYAQETRSGAHLNFYNYVHSILIVMLWVLPINLPVLVVWIHNLAVHWLTPFSSHHNVLSIMPLLLLVETLTSGKMIPRMTTSLRYVTNTLFCFLAIYAAVYGVTYAYLLHHLFNFSAAWLVAVHLSNSTFSLSGLSQMLEGEDEADEPNKKRP
ncbi:MAG: GPI inositol deacylase [Geoglossum umbratile]|nr:MAG: GPI inositol deacylase [Geoglossum umbratile]